MKWTTRVLIVTMVLATAGPIAGVAQDESLALVSDVRGRVEATVLATMDNWTAARASRHDAAAKGASARAEGAADSPFVILYGEGFDGFDRTANAQNTLQAMFPFNMPGQSGAARHYAEAALEGVGADQRAIVIHVAREAGRQWVEQAASLERVEIRRVRLERIDQALALHEARFQLGEVAGTEVMQLDLEHVRETSRLASTEALNSTIEGRLYELCGDACVMPRLGDLVALVEETDTTQAGELTLEAVEGGGLLQQARAASVTDLARAKLIARTAYGRPMVGVEWEYVPSFEGVPSFHAWGAMVSLPLPIGRSGKQLKVAARENAMASEERIEGTRRELFRRAQTARTDAEAASRRLSTLRTVFDDLPDIEFSLVQQFRLGAISYLGYLDGLARLDDVRFEVVDAWEQLLQARLELGSILADSSAFPIPTNDEETP